MKLKCLLIASLALPAIVCGKMPVVGSISPSSQEKSTDEVEIFDSNVSTTLYGYVSDTRGKSIEGVVVSDGYTCTATNAEGRYEITPSEHAVQINISIPAEYEVPMSDGLPYFWRTIADGQQQYDFTLTPLQGGAEKEFNLICIADPQTQNATHASRLETMYIPDIREETEYLSEKAHSYGVVLGDVIWNNASHYLRDDILPRIKRDWSAGNTGLPAFMVIGNHDHTYRDADDIDAQRDFEATFGPINYSFNRADAHIVCMDDIYFTEPTAYLTAFRDDQVEWLRQDLSYVPKDKLLILCVHSPLRNRSGKKHPNVQKILALCDQFPGYHVMSGHMHVTENSEYPTHYEHNHGALCGALWSGKVCVDGTPNGYAVYTINGNEFSNWYYKSAEYDRNHQIRLYHGDEWFMQGYENRFQFRYNDKNQVIANVWNADEGWTVEIYEDGVYAGEMTRFSDRDAWASGYYLGPVGRKMKSDYDKSEFNHFYYYTLKKISKKTKVEVVATDKFGNVYRQTEFTSNKMSEWPEF